MISVEVKRCTEYIVVFHIVELSSARENSRSSQYTSLVFDTVIFVLNDIEHTTAVFIFLYSAIHLRIHLSNLLPSAIRCFWRSGFFCNVVPVLVLECSSCHKVRIPTIKLPSSKAHLITRTLVAATFIESVLCHGGLISPMRVIFYRPWLFKLLPDLWRLATPFLLTSRGLSFIFDLYFRKSSCNPLVKLLLKLMLPSSVDI